MGRTPNKRIRLGHKEKKRVTRLANAVRRFTINTADATRGETTLNKRLIVALAAADSEVSSKKTVIVQFVGERFIPDGVCRGKAAYPLLAIECKKLPNSKAAKKNWKEGLAQATLYARRYKVVLLVLYDFTQSATYKKAFGRGNKAASSLARTLRDGRITTIVLAP